MKTKFFTALLSLLTLFFHLNSFGQDNNLKTSSSVEVIQFHSENRCYTCKKIEEFAMETVKEEEGVSFRLVNVDDKKNKTEAEKFNAYGTALYLFNPATGKKKDLTDFAFMNARNKDKFISELKKQITEFLKS